MHVGNAFALSTTPGGGARAPRRAAAPAGHAERPAASAGRVPCQMDARTDRADDGAADTMEHLLLCAVRASTSPRRSLLRRVDDQP